MFSCRQRERVAKRRIIPERILRGVRPSIADIYPFEFVIKFDRLTEGERDTTIDFQYDRFRQGKDPEETDELRKFISWA